VRTENNVYNSFPNNLSILKNMSNVRIKNESKMDLMSSNVEIDEPVKLM